MATPTFRCNFKEKSKSPKIAWPLFWPPLQKIASSVTQVTPVRQRQLVKSNSKMGKSNSKSGPGDLQEQPLDLAKAFSLKICFALSERFTA